jgi:diguanylate cyclase (GGDEF)-like protein
MSRSHPRISADHRSPGHVIGQTRRPLVWALILVALGSAVTSIASFGVARSTMRGSIRESSLPLTSDSVYSEVRKLFIEPLSVARQMATNTFVHEWAEGTEDGAAIRRYLSAVRTTTKADTSFFISHRTFQYYHPDFQGRTVSPDDPEDSWYFTAAASAEPYQINIDADKTDSGVLVVFVNYQVRNASGEFLGITGVGMKFSTLAKTIERQSMRFDQTIYFADRAGTIVVSGPTGPELGSSLTDRLGTSNELLTNATFTGEETLHLTNDSTLINGRFIPELGWFLMVEQSDTTTVGPLRRVLVINIATGLGISSLIAALAYKLLAKSQRTLHETARRDPLTGAFNRRAGVELLDRLTETASDDVRNRHTVMMIDIDLFKDINDEHGHLVGDQVLQSTVQAISETVRKSDAVIRWGGEEFVVVLEQCSTTESLRIAEEIRNAIAALYLRGVAPVQTTASIGVASLNAASPWEDSLRNADLALYESKRNGRDKVTVDANFAKV